MKKLLIILSIMIMASILVVPNHTVSAQVTITHPEVTGTVVGMVPCERDWTEGGISHWRNCVVYFQYETEDDSRLVGTNMMIMNRNIFADIGYPAVGHGSWILDPVNVDGGYWAGTFTANIDEAGYMSVYIRGKGFGTLSGLSLENIVHGIGGTGPVTITELPSYDGPPA